MRFVLCALLLALACSAGAVTSVVESFDGAFVAGPIGPIPSGWNYFGYGQPAFTVQEAGIVTSGTAWRVNVPGNSGNGTIAIYQLGVDWNSKAAPGAPIDWTKPVYLKGDVFGVDYSANQWKATLDVGGSNAFVDFDATNNEQWLTLTSQISSPSSNLILFLDFNFPTMPQTNALIWDNLRLDYTAVPEPGTIAVLLMGMGGLAGGMKLRRK